MESKSTKHKEENTFKFLPFSERIDNINIDVFHKVRHEYELQTEEGECFFYQTIHKWNTLNLTEGYDHFKKEIRIQNYVTLPQLLLDKERIVEVLLRHIWYKNVLCLQPLLEIAVALAQDLQKDFYPYYSQFLEILIDLLNTKNSEQLEWAFTCLAYMFKFLWRPFIKNINNVFNSLLPLLSDSKPNYINSFAAESFAFVARKVKDKEGFLDLLITAIRKRNDGIPGCGRLLFEVIKGVNGQFHSCAEHFLPFLLESLCNDKYSDTILFEIVEQIIANIALMIHPQKNTLIWEIIFNFLSDLQEQHNNGRHVENGFQMILKLLGQLTEYKEGKLLKNPSNVVQQLVKVLSPQTLQESIKLISIQISTSILLSPNIVLPQEQASQLIRKILSLDDKKLLLYFVDNVNSCSSFEILVLPYFLRKCGANQLDKEYLHSLTKLVLKKAPLCVSGINITNWCKYLLDFKEYNEEMFVILKSILDDTWQNNFERYCSILVVLPHIYLNNQKRNTILIQLNDNLKSLLRNFNNSECDPKMIFLLNMLLESIAHMEGQHLIKENFKNILNILLNIKSLTAIKTLSLIVTMLKTEKEIVTLNTLQQIDAVCQKNFNSPYHEVRLYTSHIYTAFESLSHFNLKHSDDPEVPQEEFKVFSLCFELESIESNVQTYREQLLRLEKLNFDKPQMIMCNKTEFRTIPLRYTLGVLYINFRLLWEPATKVIESFAHGFESDVFWKVFGAELKNAVQNIKKPPEISTAALDSKLDILQRLYEQNEEITAKSDFVNYRRLLWNAMTLFADVAEAKTRDLSELFLDFIENEYTRKNAELVTTCNIKEYSVVEEEDAEETVDSSEEKARKNKKAKNRVNELKKNGKKTVIRLLLEKLTVFSKFKSPKSVYREPELYQLYFELLKHKNADIQKTALDCIMTYKFKYLTPYKTHLYNLIDDKNFKHVLTNFRVDKETADIQVEHREKLLPVLLQIVFSQMSTKAGLRTGGKSSGQNRRSLILKFLAGCEENEMLIFVQKAFFIYSKFVKDDDMELVEYVANGVNLEKCFGPKKLLSTLNLVNVILDQCGGLMGNNLLTYLLKIIFVIGSMIRGVTQQQEQVHSGYLALLRNVRTSCIGSLERFFDHFDHYPWTSTQTNAVFITFVWPYLDKLTIEGIHSPTALFKLFKQWGSNTKYFKLLVKHKEGDTNQFILPHIFKLLINEKCNITVTNAIYEMMESMLKYEKAEDEVEIEAENVLPIKEDILKRIDSNDKLNYGSCILLPHVPAVLEKIKRKLEGKNKNIHGRELFILSRVSELVWESDISDKILHLLLPIALKKCTADEDVVEQLFITICNLIKNVNDPKAHLQQIVPLFGAVPHASSRKILIQILNRIAEKSPDMSNTAYLVSELNAFDARWLDQPDFERRHAGFKLIQNAVNEDTIDVNLGTLLVHNCFYLLNSEKDLALKDSASHTLKVLCPYLINKHQKSYKYLEQILTNCIFDLIKGAMRTHNNMDLRNECISLLGHLARECPDSHFILRDLNKYTNKDDLEVDFFENLTHLQIHRHARAMLKFCQVTSEQTVAPNTKTLTQFLLPLASHYLCSEKFVGKNSVIDAAIEMVGLICRILPWHQYEGVLKFCLFRLKHKVEYQKQLVRLTVAILDAFHFDLTKGHVVIETTKKDDSEKIENNVNEKGDEDVNTEGDVEVEDVLDETEQIEDEVDEEPKERDQTIVEKISVLCKSTATRIIKTIQVVLLPQLHRSLAELTRYESSHKVNRKKTGIEREEEDMARVPISLAVVKLLQRLPKEILDLNLPGVFLKLCSFLKSQLESVRRIARETLQKIMLTLGPKYLRLLLGEMAPLLNRGFQVHVLVFTVHGVLSCLKGTYEPYDIDDILRTVLNLCTADLFGILSEEKEVVKITVKVAEAKSTKSYDTLQILAQHITEKCLTDLILPIKQFIEANHSFKTIQKVQEALRHVVLGLADNTFISIESLLKFAYGTSAQKIVQLLPTKKKHQKGQGKDDKLLTEKEDCMIIPKIPGNRTSYRELNVKVSSNTNSYLLVEFGLKLCLILLKRDKLKEPQFGPFLDPFVEIFKSCLKSKHVKLCTLTLQCLQWVMKSELPSMIANIKPIAKDMFSILHKYAASGLSKGDNFDLVVASFKAMAVLVRDVQYYKIDTNHLKILLMYVEQDMHDHDRQATAFSLLKAVISRKLNVTEINKVMDKVAELSITAELPHVRTQARMVYHQFLMDYPLGNTLEKHLGFYISQLSFQLQHGRESAIEMIQMLINSFPLLVLKNHSSTFLITLGARLVNEDVPECRKMIAACLSSMLNRLTKPDRDPLFEVICLWLKDKELPHRRLAAQLCGILITVEKKDFETRLPVITPLILKQFGLTRQIPGKFVKIEKEKILTDEMKRVQDHHKFQVLQLILKVCAECPSFLKKTNEIELLSYHVQSLLGYPHDWVRLAAAQFLGFVLAAIDIDNLAKLLLENGSDDGYLCGDPESYLKALTLDLCDQLQPGNIKPDLAEQVIKNLVFVAKVLQKVPIDSDIKVNLLWLSKRMRKIVNSEIIENASSIVLRTEVFKWIAGVGTVVDLENIKPVLNHLLAPLVREMVSTEEKNAPLRQLSKEVARLLKNKVGVDLYTKTLQSLQQNLEVKRAERKRTRTQLAVTDPELFAQKKIKRHERKKILKKRKLEELRGKKTFKRRKVVDLEDNSDIM